MFREMRRKEKKMPEEQAKKILRETEYGTLATWGQEGYPCATPLNFYYNDEGELYFHTAHEGHKISNIDYCAHVSFSVVGSHRLMAEKFDTEYDSVTLFGTASRIDDEKEKMNALMLLVGKYSSDYRIQGLEYIEKFSGAVSVYRIRIEHVTGKIGR